MISGQSAKADSLPGRPTVGLVLGAGGVRGCAHAGIISVLLETGIPIDVVVGASVGAIFGLGIAAGLPPEHIARVGRSVSPAEMFRFYFTGRLRLDSSNPVARTIWEGGKDKTFADLPRRFAVRVTDMATGEPFTVDRGPILPAIQASIALPLIARPVWIGDRLCVDGGLFDTVPVHVARQLGAQKVVAVCLGFNFSAPQFLRRRGWIIQALDRWGRQQRPRGHPGALPDRIRFGCRLLSAASAGSWPYPEGHPEGTRYPGSDADVAIWPEFHDLSPNSMSGAAFAFAQGVEAARRALPAIERMVAFCSPGPNVGVESG